MTSRLQRIVPFLLSRRVLAVAVLIMAFSNLNIWRNVEGQGSANFFCDREDFITVPGPSGLIVTSHQTDCDTIAKESMTFVYLHPPSNADASSNLIFRYDGDAPHPSWIDPAHLIIRAGRIGYVDKLVALRDGVHVAADFIDTSDTSTQFVPAPPTAGPN